MQQILLSTRNNVMKNCFLYQQLLVALVSSYRYDGSKTNDRAIKLDAQKLEKATSIGDKKQLIKDEEIVRILTTRSKIHLIAVIKCYQETFNKNIIEV